MTRTLTLSDTALLAWTGVGMYFVDLEAATAVPMTDVATGQTFVFYEVSDVAPTGSWWLQVAAQAQVPPAWLDERFGGIEALQATGSGIPTSESGAPIQRPSHALVWIPASTMTFAVPAPTQVAGSVVGDFPTFAPTPVMTPTRWLFLPDTVLAGWSGVGVYRTGMGAPTPLAYLPSGQALVFYEVAPVAGQGSWWLPVSPASSVPASWSRPDFGDVVALQASGPGIWTQEGGQTRLRPATALWWLPDAVQTNQAYLPGSALGTVTGAFPDSGPSIQAAPPPTAGVPPPPAGVPPPATGLPPPAAGVPPDVPPANVRGEPEGGPDARQAHFASLRGLPAADAVQQALVPRTRSAGHARAAAVREHRERIRQARASDAPQALVAVPAPQTAGVSQRPRLAQPARPGVVNWIPIGPSVVLDGQTATRAPVSGRITGVGVAADGLRVYVGSANGGVWRSDDAGRTFYPLMNAFELHPTANNADSLSVGALAIDPQRPDRVYVGSGEGNISDAYFGVGPIVSDDGGLTWRVEQAPVNSTWFFALALDPADPERVLAATSLGLLRREARNASVGTLPIVKPQSYFVRYDTQTGAYSVDYWTSAGTSAIAVQSAGALTWPPDATAVTMVLAGEPWLLRYQRHASQVPPALAGHWETFRIAGDGTLQARATGDWAPNSILMAFEMGGEPYVLRYIGVSGVAWLVRMQPAGDFVTLWAAQQWGAGITQLVSFVLSGVPHFILYPVPGEPQPDAVMLRAWSGTGQPFDVWPAALVLGLNLTFAAFELLGAPFLVVYDTIAGDVRVARVERDGRLTFVPQAQQTWAAGLSLTTFTLGRQPRLLAYDGASGDVTVYTFDPEGVPVRLWSSRWGTHLACAPFTMGYEWVNAPVVGHLTNRNPAIQARASAVVAARRDEQSVFYAAFWGGGIYRSVDDGVNWLRVGTNTPGAQGTAGANDPFAGIGRVSLAVQPSEPAVLYAQLQNGQVWRYEASGRTPLTNKWERVNGEPAGYTGDQGNYDLVIAVAPDNVNRIYLGGMGERVSVGGAPDWSGAIYRAEVTVNSVFPSTMAPLYLGAATHSDIHALVFTPGNPNALWAGTDGGLFFSATAALQFSPGNQVVLTTLFASRNTGLATMTANALGQHPLQDAIVFESTQDNGLERYTGSAAWKLSFVSGDSGRVLVNQDPVGNGQLVLATYTKNELYRSIDGGNSVGATITLPLSNGDGMAFYAPLVAAPASANMFLRVAFGTRRPWVSDNFGDTGSWHALGNPLGTTKDFNVTALAFSADGLTLYVGLANGQVYRYVDAGLPAGWGVGVRIDQAVGGALPAWANVPITSLTPDPNNATGLFATLGGDLVAQVNGWQRVWYFDGGANAWAARSGPGPGHRRSLMNVQTNALAARVNLAQTQLFVGADVGLWKSDDGGQNWDPFGTALPEAAVVDLTLMPARNLVTTTPPTPIAAPALLRATTHGRGAYEYVLDPAARHARPVQLYLRCSILDRGLYAVQDGAADPTRPAHIVNHRDGVAFAVLETFGGGNSDRFRLPADITFAEFADIRGDNRDISINTRLRLYVEVNNRGIVPADKVRVALLLSRRIDPNLPVRPVNDMASVPAPPDLPANYEQQVRADQFVVSADWNTVAILSLDDLRAGFPEVVSTDLPADTIRQDGVYCLLAIVHSPDNPFLSNERNVDRLTIDDSQVALGYLFADP
jgi:hypothetical protein